MIPLAKLQAVRRVVAHGSCADGMVSAILCKDALPEATIEFGYHTSEPYLNMVVEPGMLFVDIVPPPLRVAEFVAAGALVLDHHRTNKPTIDAFGENAVFGDEAANPGTCGATLVYEHVWKPLRGECASEGIFASQFARLAGVRDTWQRRDPEWSTACAYQAALMFMPASHWMSMTLTDIAWNWDAKYKWVGEAQVQRFEERVDKTIDRAYRFTTPKGLKVVVFEGTGLTSDVTGKLDREVDIIVGFSYITEAGERKIVLSTRSHTGFDCGAFTLSFGGGGHTRAAAFSTKVLPDDPNPFTYVERLLARYETGLDSKSQA